MIFSDQNLARRLERAEARSNAAFVEARAKLFPASNAEWTAVAGTYAMFDGAESPLTQTFGLGVFGAVTDAEVNELETFFAKHDAPVLHEVSPMADLSVLPLLKARRYQPVEMTSVMYQELKSCETLDLPLNPEIKTRIIKPGEEKLWAGISAGGWSAEMPELSDFMLELGQISGQSVGGFPFLAEIDAAPIAAGMLFIYDDVALLAGASTVPEGRRKGAQLALLNARLRYAAENGCTLATMGALPGSQSQRNAEKNNFRIAYTRTKWQLVK